MKKVYLVWYKLDGDTEDRIRGGALNWERAEKMALHLEFYLQAQGITSFNFGVKTYQHGIMNIDLLGNDGAYESWSKDKFDVEVADETGTATTTF